MTDESELIAPSIRLAQVLIGKGYFPADASGVIQTNQGESRFIGILQPFVGRHGIFRRKRRQLVGRIDLDRDRLEVYGLKNLKEMMDLNHSISDTLGRSMAVQVVTEYPLMEKFYSDSEW